MRETFRLGRVAGIPIGANASVAVVVVLIAVGLALGRFPQELPGRSGAAYAVAGLVAAAAFLVSLLAHEIAHALVARRNGVEVEGITLWLLGGVARLRGEAPTPGAELRIAGVGPLTSLVLSGAFAATAALMALGGADGLPLEVVQYLAVINLALAVFNLVPAAPLDGGRLLRAALWRRRGDARAATVTAARVGRGFGFLLIGLGVLQLVSGAGLGGVWLALIGLFIVNAATAEEQHAQVSGRLSGLTVEQVMGAPVVGADPDATVQAFLHDVALHTRHSTYPLLDDGRLVGLVTLNRLRAVAPDARATTRLADVACAPQEVPVGRPQEPLTALLTRMGGCADGRAVVVDDAGRVVGLLSPSDVARTLQLADLAAFEPYPGAGGGADVSRAARDDGAVRHPQG